MLVQEEKKRKFKKKQENPFAKIGKSFANLRKIGKFIYCVCAVLHI